MIKRLLCVDDDNITLTLTKLVVGKASFAEEIITRHNGKEALDYYIGLSENTTSQNYPELIFLDLNMPIMGGWDFLEEFNKNFYPQFNQTRVVILSSSTDPEEKERAKQYPMIVDYLPKPITVSILNHIEERLGSLADTSSS